MKDKIIKRAKAMSVAVNIIGLALIMIFHDSDKSWMSVGCGMLIAGMLIWSALNPLVDDEEDD